MSAGISLAVLGAGAFGTALAMTQAGAGRPVVLWGRDGARMGAMATLRENAQHLPGLRFADALQATGDIADVAGAKIVLLAVPTQSLRGLLAAHATLLQGKTLIACCKGVERGTGALPHRIIAEAVTGAEAGVLTGPSFAADIAAGKPTALTLAMQGGGGEVQAALSTSALRLYLSDDPTGAALGGALKNVVAIAAGIAIGAGLGDSARAALMTRGFAEMTRYATGQGAQGETLFGLSGFGDLVLTCTSEGSRNFRFGLAFGAGQEMDETVTVEGKMTALAVSEAEAQADLPITHMVARLLRGEITLEQAIEALLARPLRAE